MLGQQFMHNAGAPYKFVVQTASQPLDEAAPVIREAIDLIQKRANILVPCEFNEILSVAYMEGQRMDVRPRYSSLIQSTIMTESQEFTTL